jgi:bilirubin oxidase
MKIGVMFSISSLTYLLLYEANMTNNNLNRRQFLKYTGLGLASTAFPQLLLANTSITKSYPSANFKADVELEFTSKRAFIQVLKHGSKTAVQKYYAKVLKGDPKTLLTLKGNYLGPIVNLEQGQKVRVFFNNELDEPSIIHWHGLHVPQRSDGHPMYAIQPGEQYVYEFEVLNRAGTNFYHSHTHGETGRQVYNGLASMIRVTDEHEKKLGLPTGEYDLPLVIQDRSFDSDNQLSYIRRMPERMMGFLGEMIMVNGKPNIEFSVKSRAYRFRALNGSNSRIYKLAWDDGTPITVIGTDGGLLEKTETRPYVMLAPAERLDLWLDFSGRKLGSELKLYSMPYDAVMPMMYRMHGRMGSNGIEAGTKFKIASFKVTEIVSDSPKLPTQLATIKRFSENDVNNANNPIPIGLSMRHMSALINGKSFSMDRVMKGEQVELGSHKKIKIFHEHGSRGRMGMGMGMMGGMSMPHPIHLHGQQYQILSRTYNGNDEAAYATVNKGFIDNGWKDTVLVMPGEEIEIIKPFEDYKGYFLYHCHNLEHEDLGMMRQFYVG